jgi:transglutaminase-like putative cysteine protease
MMKRRLFTLTALLCALFTAYGQKAVVEEYAIDVDCDKPTHAIQHFREVTTILTEQGAPLASFVCSCSKNDKLTRFKGLVTDATGRVIRKLKESELQKTEYSQYLAIDDYKMFLDYTPPVYPVTISYEWTIESHDNLLEFPRFCPQSDYDITVKKASYRLKVPKDMNVRYALQQLDTQVAVSDMSAYTQLFAVDVSDMPMLRYEPYGRPFRERMPMICFAPTDFVYYGTKGSLATWNDYGQWEYSLINGLDALPENVCQELHQLTDPLPTARQKVEALYKRLEKTTRYVAILLGIGGQKPAPAASVCKSGYGDCKGLSNYMRAMLKAVGIDSHYTTISTTNRRFLPGFASVGQMNHAILQVPLPGDTLWLECTNPQLPMGYVHDDIAGHDAIEISKQGGRLVRLPVYADSANAMHSTIDIRMTADGSAAISVHQQTTNQQYEDQRPLLRMDAKDRLRVFQRMVHVPQADISNLQVSESGSGPQMTLAAEVKSNSYATRTGQRLFVPVCPVHQGYSVPAAAANRTEDIWFNSGYLDEDDITLTIPDGYSIEASPKDVILEQPFATFSFTLKLKGNTLHIKNRLLRKSGRYDKSLYPQLQEFYRTISKTYNQKIVLKKNAS